VLVALVRALFLGAQTLSALWYSSTKHWDEQCVFPLNPSNMSSTFVVVGGGIAGVSCVEQLSQICAKETITFITARDVVKAAHNLKTYGRTLEEFDVKEQSANSVFNHCPNVVIVQSQVVAFNPEGTYHKN